MKKILLLFTMLFMSITSHAYDIAVENADGVVIYYEWANSEKTELSVSYTSKYNSSYYSNYSGNVLIPESVIYESNTYRVTAIGDYAFINCEGLTSINIPNSVKSIGVSSFEGCSGLTTVTIPNSVTNIGYQAFIKCSGLISVVISNNVTSITSSAFSQCSSLTSVTIPNNVMSIGNYTFSGCSSLSSVTIPNSVTEIGEFAFSGCKQLSQLIFPTNLKKLEIGVCYECENLNSVVIPSGVEFIGRSAFNGCKSLEEFKIPDSVKEIESMAFKNCSSLTKIYWGNSIEKVGGDLFTGCRILGDVYISDISKWCKTEFTSELANPLYKQGVVGGGVKLFLNGEIVDTLFVPNDIDIVRKYTFYGYTWLKSIKFPESDINIEDNAFSECRQLNSIYFGESIAKLGNQVFNHCEDIQYVVSKCREPYMFWDWTFYKPIYGKCTLFIPTGTKEIYTSTSGWKNFTNVKETDVEDPGLKVSLKVSGEGEVSVNNTNVGDNNTIIALYDTDVNFTFKPKLGYQLKSFLINGEELAQDVVNDTYVINQIHDNINVEITFEEIPLAEGVLFSDNRIFYSIIENENGFCLEVTRKMKSGNTWLYIGDIVIPEYVIFHGDTLFVERIGENAFKGSGSIYSVTTPNTIKSIGKSAFGNCTVLKSITIPSSVETIENGAFNGCTAITSFIIPNSVKTIEAGAFYCCTKLSSITFSNSLCDVGYDAFGYTKWYDSKPNGMVYAGPVAYKYKGTIPQGTSVNVKNGTLGIAEQCFLNCTGLVSITIPETVINIGNSAMQGCTGLTSIIIPESVPYISNNMLSLCSNLTEITLGGNVETIGSYAFAYTNVKEINLPDGLKEIGDFSFVLCSNLKAITIPESVNTIGKSAFEGCSKLSKITIPASIQSIGERALFLSGLNTIESHLLEPFPISDDVFNIHVKDYTTLIVPIGTKEVYQHTDGWKSIKNIKEYGVESGIENNYVNQGHIVLDGSSVIILGGTNHLIQIYDVSGKLIKRVGSTKEDIRIELHCQGTYIIQMGSESYKIIIK